MSGIAVAVGTRIDHGCPARASRSLSTTGLELTGEFYVEGMAGASVAHSPTDGSLTRSGGHLLFLAGYVLGIEGAAEPEPGSPVSAERVLRELIEAGPDAVGSFNGSFAYILYDLESGRLDASVDRLCSRQLYYTVKGGAIGFASRVRALEALGFEPFERLRPAGFAQLLSFSRVFDDGSVWEGVNSLSGGSRLTYHGGDLRLSRYHAKRFTYMEGGRRSEEENALRFAAELDGSVRRTAPRTGGGVLLSGGLDSRAVIACGPATLTGLTFGDCDNLEVKTARKVAAGLGNRHVTLRRSPRHYEDILQAASEACEGGFDYQHDHLEGLTDQVLSAGVTTLMHGHGVDTICRGIYLPCRTLRVKGLTVTMPELKPVAFEDAAGALKAKFSIADPAYLRLVGDLRSECVESVDQALDSFVEENSACIINSCDLFELFVFDTRSRSNTFPFIIGLRDRIEERGPSWDNSLLDFCLSTPPEQRVGSRVFKKALKSMNPDMARIIDCNDMLPGSARPPARAYAAWMLGLAVMRKGVRVSRRLAVRGGGSAPWLLGSGSYPYLIDLWRYGHVGSVLEHLLADERATRDGLLDRAAVKRLLAEHTSGAANNFSILSTVLTFLDFRSRH